jgi:cardiolipin synthase
MIKQRELEYLASSKRISKEQVRKWSMPKRLWNNTIALLGPLL